MNFALIDSHPLILTGYKSVIRRIYSEATFYKTTSSHQLLEEITSNCHFDFFIIGYLLNNHPNNKIQNACDLVHEIKKTLPDAKIIIITSHDKALTLYEIHKKLCPNGLLTKTNTTIKCLENAIEQIIEGKRYYCSSTLNRIDQIKNIPLLREQRNIQILKLLKQGYKLGEIGDNLYLSTRAIERRVSLIKKSFKVNDIPDLIKEACKHDFI